MTKVAQDRQDSDTDLARWLEDSGRRRAVRLDEPPEELLALIETHTGASLRTREDITAYFDNLRAQEVERSSAEGKRRSMRECILLVLLAASAAHYHYWDVSLQIAGFQKVYYFVPPAIGRQSASSDRTTT